VKLIEIQYPFFTMPFPKAVAHRDGFCRLRPALSLRGAPFAGRTALLYCRRASAAQLLVT
jgi:hypothetical protein